MPWSCPHCTLINTSTSTCEACGYMNPLAVEIASPAAAAASNVALPQPSPLSSYRLFVSTCFGCQNSIWPSSSTVQALGNTYHQACFRCTACSQPLPRGIRFQIHANEPYHPECFRELYHPRCDVCDERLPITADGRIPYHQNLFWKQKYCPSHEQRDRCCSCRRLEPTASARHFEKLADGRKLCGDCAHTVILDTDEVQPVVQDVWAFLASLGMHLPELPVFLVDFDTLNAQSHCEHSTDSQAPAVYGVCLSEVKVTFHHFAHRAIQQLFRLDKPPSRRVNGIMILHGLPFDMTAYILAHEATHAYFKLHEGFPSSLPAQVEEGTCQLMGYLYLQYRKVMATPDESSQHAIQLRDWYIQSLVEDTSPVYGDGLRAALHAFNAVNSLQFLLDHIRETSGFPRV
ncbi:hypothetical protein AaE_007203 [Aphanomyces astaci]|uniref:LIM zinc-binding domain-containing protein n=3 Tax=Aphanomyces astaci TaxID=112090 RepID=A0A6A5ABV8_APHAT|nr:hypothetical protein AaE_007203 [Aphanomyces astaci]